MRTRDLGDALPGVLLIVIGLALFAGQFVQTSGGLVLGIVGLSFLTFFALTRRYGLLIPGTIISGLAIGVGLEEAGYGYNGSTVLLGLGGGFVAIYLIGTLVSRETHWWPLIPGGLLTIIGASQAIVGTDAELWLGRSWPLALIVVGLLLLIRAREKPHTTAPPTGPGAQT